MTYTEFWKSLTALYDEGEAKAIGQLVMDVRYGLSLADVLCGRTGDDEADMRQVQQRLLAGEPVQYVLGVAEFGGRQFHVEPGVLIPRPETYEMCQLVMRSERRRTKRDRFRILDVGTGSGCIACTLAAELPQVGVTAWDISQQALAVARDNAQRLGVKVTFEQQDALCPPDNHRCWDVIVSNPPYVCEHERAQMARHVVDHEPPLALFVPDDDPLRFYTAIGTYALQALKADGYVLFEINAALADDTRKELRHLGFGHVRLMKDQFGKDRFILAAIRN